MTTLKDIAKEDPVSFTSVTRYFTSKSIMEFTEEELKDSLLLFVSMLKKLEPTLIVPLYTLVVDEMKRRQTIKGWKIAFISTMLGATIGSAVGVLVGRI
ncbi:hypothetical protein EHQ61_08660 [Leptospira wolffii]|uniref:hypothetical protein n=1 Tax=Leptospira wolffii TaxID=409998 RepID=UPI001082699E|nr:hypothetical protein [Leptospira wolffii]TGL50804.1 hypothetical protein EHQ61_08660 [Leptospira wolffii]